VDDEGLQLTTAVTDNTQAHRYEIWADGRLAGFTTYLRHPGIIEFVHTEIGAEYEGRGLAGELIRSVLDTARASGSEVLPLCPFVRGYIERHPRYLELVPANRRARFDLPA
jgi:uncharacterized protein